MKYMGDSKWWDKRFEVRELNIMPHEKCLEDDMKFFSKSGKILDIACGDGRNATFLGKLGYQVIGVDFSRVALQRLDYFAQKENLTIKTKLVDLSTADEFFRTNENEFDGVIINHYRLKPQLYHVLMKHIKTNGILWVNGFRDVLTDNPNIKITDVLMENDFLSIKDCKLEDKKLYEIGEKKCDKLLFCNTYFLWIVN